MQSGNVPFLRDAISSSEEEGVENVRKNKLFRALAAVVLACGPLTGCGIQPLTGVYEYAVTDPYDIQQVNKLPNTGTTHLVGSHFEGRYMLRAGESRTDVIRVES